MCTAHWPQWFFRIVWCWWICRINKTVVSEFNQRSFDTKWTIGREFIIKIQEFLNLTHSNNKMNEDYKGIIRETDYLQQYWATNDLLNAIKKKWFSNICFWIFFCLNVISRLPNSKYKFVIKGKEDKKRVKILNNLTFWMNVFPKQFYCSRKEGKEQLLCK